MQRAAFHIKGPAPARRCALASHLAAAASGLPRMLGACAHDHLLNRFSPACSCTAHPAPAYQGRVHSPPSACPMSIPCRLPILPVEALEWARRPPSGVNLSGQHLMPSLHARAHSSMPWREGMQPVTQKPDA